MVVLRYLLNRRGRTALADDLCTLAWPVRLLLAALVARLAVSAVRHGWWVDAVIGAVMITALTWAATRSLLVLERALFRRLRIDHADNLRARTRVTQLRLLRRVLAVVVVAGGGFSLLLTLTPIARFGSTLVAYAGVIGVVLGLALRAPLENLVSGVLVAVTEPIRIDDVVVVEGEWGRIEEIGLVNVDVRLWDDRRLVLPTSHFVTNPFENWTRHSSHVTGTVSIWVDHRADVVRVRDAFTSIVHASRLWDGRVCALQVVELGERGVQLRGIASARNAGDAWDLRCHVREALLPLLTADERWLPRVRGLEVEVDLDPVPFVR